MLPVSFEHSRFGEARYDGTHSRLIMPLILRLLYVALTRRNIAGFRQATLFRHIHNFIASRSGSALENRYIVFATCIRYCQNLGETDSLSWIERRFYSDVVWGSSPWSSLN